MIKDIYLAIPLQKGQISCRELMNGEILIHPLMKDQPIMIDDIDSPCAYNDELKKMIYRRGLHTFKNIHSMTLFAFCCYCD